MYGRLGHGDSSNQLLPKQVLALDVLHTGNKDFQNIVNISCGLYHVMAITRTIKQLLYVVELLTTLHYDHELLRENVLVKRTVVVEEVVDKFEENLNNFINYHCSLLLYSISILISVGTEKVYGWGMGQMSPRIVDGFDGRHIVQVSCGEYETLALTRTTVPFAHSPSGNGDILKWNWGQQTVVPILEGKRIWTHGIHYFARYCFGSQWI